MDCEGRTYFVGLILSIFTRVRQLSVCQIKRYSFRDSTRAIDELKTKIRYAIQAINENTLQRVYKNIKMRLNFVVRERIGAFEPLISK